MTDLRALVGACFLLAVMGMVVVAPLGWWAVVLGFGEAFPAKIIKARPYQGKDKLVQKQILWPEGRDDIGPDQIDAACSALWRAWAALLAITVLLALI